MTGFKSGASPSGLDDSEDNEADDNATSSRETEQRSSTDSPEEENTVTEPSSQAQSSGLPWIYERSSITDGRAKTVQLHLQQETLDIERDVKTDIESRIGETVNKADLREAAYLVGLAHLEDINEKLSEWGYDAD